MENILVVGIAEEHEDLKLVRMNIETFLISYYGFLDIDANKDGDNRKLTDDEKFELEQLLLGLIQIKRNGKTLKVMPTMSFPVAEYLENIYVR